MGALLFRFGIEDVQQPSRMALYVLLLTCPAPWTETCTYGRVGLGRDGFPSQDCRLVASGFYASSFKSLI